MIDRAAVSGRVQTSLAATPLRALKRALRLTACVLTLCGVAGCGDACLNLAQQICNCLPNDQTGAQQACIQRASDAETVFSVRSNDQAYCQHQLDTNACDCTQLQTAAGKLGCGIAYPSSTSAAGSGPASRAP